MTVSYSKEADVLYLIFSDQKAGATYVEKDNGDILRLDADSGRLLGVTIQLFRHRLGKGERIDVPEVGMLDLVSASNLLTGANFGKAI